MTKIFQTLVNYSLQQVLVFGMVAGLAFYFLAFDDGAAYVAEIASAKNDIQKEEEHRKDTEATLKEVERMKESVGTLSKQYQEISRRLPTNLTSIELNRNIDAFARNSGVSIKARKPLSVISREIVDEIPVQVTLEGGYGDLGQFIYLVSAAERATSVRTFSLAPLDPRSTRLRLEGTVIGYQLSTAPPKNAPARGRGGAK